MFPTVCQLSISECTEITPVGPFTTHVLNGQQLSTWYIVQHWEDGGVDIILSSTLTIIIDEYMGLSYYLAHGTVHCSLR